MVRFIIFTRSRSSPCQEPFTFQYGQIYYENETPIINSDFLNLHSNMVRFIMEKSISKETSKYAIYIPIWLDLLQQQARQLSNLHLDLHSNMVRFIIIHKQPHIRLCNLIYIPIWLDLLYSKTYTVSPRSYSFTFQYGQIYYSHDPIMIDAFRKFTFQYGQIYYD